MTIKLTKNNKSKNISIKFKTILIYKNTNLYFCLRIFNTNK